MTRGATVAFRPRAADNDQRLRGVEQRHNQIIAPHCITEHGCGAKAALSADKPENCVRLDALEVRGHGGACVIGVRGRHDPNTSAKQRALSPIATLNS